VLPAVTERLAIPRYISGIMEFEDGALPTWTSEEDFDHDILVNLKHVIEMSVFLEQSKTRNLEINVADFEEHI
jgi:hypothetical protein